MKNQMFHKIVDIQNSRRRNSFNIFSFIKKLLGIIINIIFFPFELLYKLITSKFISFFVNFTFLIMAFFFFTFHNQLLELFYDVDLKIGGIENIKCREAETIKNLRTSTVRIVGGESEGSGFSIEMDTDIRKSYVLTNFHVIENEPAPKVVFLNKYSSQVEIIAADKNTDLALLLVSDLIPPLKFKNSDELNPGDALISFGYAFGSELVGEATVKKGVFSGKRKDKVAGVEYIQTDSTLNPGMSGGPMTDICGRVVGINKSGTTGMGMAISANDIETNLSYLKNSKEPLKDIKIITFNPNQSPLDAVTTFYNYIKMKKMEKAFGLLGEKFLSGGNYKNWVKGYIPNLDTSVLKIETYEENKDLVKVKLITKDLIDEEIITKYFEGTWEVKEVDGNLKLWWPQIKEVPEPDWMWFYE
ncbi:conserved hypothetical protein [Candidatus Roizmanbacteria bacterium]|nr:conserved hypothetical protein [Candidatus Roizmanbacteria bacterium]